MEQSASYAWNVLKTVIKMLCQINKITSITDDGLPTFFSDESDFNVTFWNLNYE